MIVFAQVFAPTLAFTTAHSGLIARASLWVLLSFLWWSWSSLRWRRRTHGRPLPPGPHRLPIVGSLLGHPRAYRWVAYHELTSLYGDILYFKVLKSSILVLDSARAAKEMLEKKAANTADRSQNPMIELSGSSLNFGFMPYGQWWRRHRRAFWQHFNREAVVAYWPAQRDVAYRFLGKLLFGEPSRLRDHIRSTIAGGIFKVVYNIDDADTVGSDGRYIAALDDALEGPVQSLVPGTFMVDFLPFLRYVPAWFPGAASQRLWIKWQAAAKQLKNVTYDEVEAALKKSAQDKPRSIMGKLIAQMTPLETGARHEQEEIAKNVGAVALEAGTDTTSNALLVVFLAMTMHPDVLKKAQAELDAVVGPDRLPNFGDQDTLVYVHAIVKETLRWHPAIPLGLPHCTVADDELDGYFVPKGTVVLCNVWACMRDPTAYEDPEKFRPERFIRDGKLDPSVRDPSAFVFGFGRRICPGRYFALSSLFVTVASVLHVFDIAPPMDDQGRPVLATHGMTEGFSSSPTDFKCTIRPRSVEAEALILAHARTGEPQ